MNKFIKMLSALVIVFTVLPHITKTASWRPPTPPGADGKGIAQVGGGVIAMVMGAGARSPGVWNLSMSFPTPDQMPAAAAAGASSSLDDLLSLSQSHAINPLERLRLMDGSAMGRSASAPDSLLSLRGVASPSYAPWIRRLPSDVWEKSMAIKNARIRQLEEQERKREIARIAEQATRENRRITQQEMEERLRSTDQGAYQAWQRAKAIARSEAAAARIEADSKQIAASAALTSSIAPAPSSGRAPRKEIIEFVRVKLLQILPRDPSEENTLNEIRSTIEEIIQIYLPYVLRTREMPIYAVTSLEKLHAILCLNSHYFTTRIIDTVIAHIGVLSDDLNDRVKPLLAMPAPLPAAHSITLAPAPHPVTSTSAASSIAPTPAPVSQPVAPSVALAPAQPVTSAFAASSVAPTPAPTSSLASIFSLSAQTQAPLPPAPTQSALSLTLSQFRDLIRRGVTRFHYS